MSLDISRRRELLMRAEQDITGVLRVLVASEDRIHEAVATLRAVLADPDTSEEQARQAREGLVTAARTLRQLTGFRREIIDTRGFIAAADARLEDLG
ncbi:hypothetical protein [Stackebrandtia albiflava]|uniref:hypothetical protein n=1 Tax=Stackebrandtia albiflava TaxID=406432 RepID=UPI0011BDB6E8|nr:hypothetical protein [Stackebrandtia albiflava]